MRVSQLLGSTLREAPRDAESTNQELLLRAGYIRQLTAGVYSFLPLGHRVLRKISQIIREELERVGGQEVTMPILQPFDLFTVPPAHGAASRAEIYGEELFRLNDRKKRLLALGPTHEEVVTTLVGEFMRSYRDLPKRIFQIQTKFRDQLRPRGGLLRTREFLMKDLYSFDVDEESFKHSYNQLKAAYETIFRRCGLDFLIVEADSGAIGGKESHEFMAVTQAGEDDALLCDSCDYAANRERAEFVRTILPDEPVAALEDVYTPGCMAISDLCAFLEIPAEKTIKAVCYTVQSRLVLVIVRGDLEVNEIKLANVVSRAGLNVADLHLATAEELAAAGIVVGYTSPLAKDESVLIVADLSLQQGNNFVAGANRADYHSKNVNYPRDYRVDIWADIASAYDGSHCVRCGGTLHRVRGSEVGHIFQLGTRYSAVFNATYLDTNGREQPLVMGCYGIGISRLMGVVVEQHHTDTGIAWPFAIAPYHIALLGLDLDKEEYRRAAEELYSSLLQAGVEVLFDDRSESAGIKFNDADLIGLPLRAVVSKRSLKNGGVELKLRTQKAGQIVPLSDAVRVIQEEISTHLWH